MTSISRSMLSRKWRMMPNREAVTHRHQTAIGVYTNYEISDAWWRDLTDSEKQTSQGVYVEHQKMWFIPNELLTETVAIGDLIVDEDGNSFTVLNPDSAGGLQVNKLTTINLVLAAGLRDSVTIQRPTNTQDAAGNRIPAYAAVYTAISGKLQEMEGERVEQVGKVGFKKHYTVYLGQRVTVTTEDRVVVSGVNYQITGYSNPDRIDELMQLSVERVP